MESKPTLRLMRPDDRAEIAELIYASINTWYRLHGRPQPFHGGPAVTEVFADVYGRIEPSRCVVAQNASSGRLMGSCFYHPRETHVGLGIMNVHPNYFGFGAGSALLRHITDFADEAGLPVRLTQSAVNLDSFSLYNRAGFVPRLAYQDMILKVPAGGLPDPPAGRERVRDATANDIPPMAALERELSGIVREPDYRHCIENELGFWHASVLESQDGRLDGFLMSSGHPAMNMLGPGVARTWQAAAALIHRELGLYPGRTPVTLIPVEQTELVRQLYDWGARNCELHFCQIRGGYQPFHGINIPTFLMETA